MTSLAQLAEAERFARKAHGSQQYGDHPYCVHLKDVVDVLCEFDLEHDPELLCAAYLHDCLEDTSISEDEIRQRFGNAVADLVEGVTDEPGAHRYNRKAATYPKVRRDPRRVALKLADRIANIRRCAGSNARLFKMYRQEHPVFHAALYKNGEYQQMWAELAQLVRGRDPVGAEPPE